MSSNAVVLKDIDLVPYLDVFLPGWNSDAIPSTLIANIALESFLYVWLKRSEDLLPFFRLIALAPRVKLRFKCPPGDSIGLALNHYFSDDCKAQWACLFAIDKEIIKSAPLFSHSDEEDGVELHVFRKRTCEEVEYESDDIKVARAILREMHIEDNAGRRWLLCSDGDYEGNVLKCTYEAYFYRKYLALQWHTYTAEQWYENSHEWYCDPRNLPPTSEGGGVNEDNNGEE